MARVLYPDQVPATDISLLALLTAGSAAATRYLLLLKFAVLNMVALALLGAAWFQTWVTAMYEGDSTHLVVVIAGAFAYGMVGCARHIWHTSEELNAVKAGTMPPWLKLETAALKLKLDARIAPTRHIANSLVFAGLIGTVIGFIIALSGVRPDVAADVHAVGPMISTLIHGMSVALYTTLVGAVLNVWLMANCRLLHSGSVALVVAVAERGNGRDSL